MRIIWVRCKHGQDVEDLLNELYSSFTNIEILGISQDEFSRYNIFYKLGERKKEVVEE